jgi:hypothetical protein
MTFNIRIGEKNKKMNEEKTENMGIIRIRRDRELDIEKKEEEIEK